MSFNTGTDQLIADFSEGVLCLTMNRPESRNALSDVLTPALRTMIAEAADDTSVRCVMITGAGGAFCAGGDVKGMGKRGIGRSGTPEERIAELTEKQRTLVGAIAALRVPTLAALPGPAAGAGLSIALACDVRIAAAGTFVSTGYARVGLSGDYGASHFLVQLVGPAKAKELLFSAERIPAKMCLQLGIVNRLAPDERFREDAMAWAKQLAAGPTEAYRYLKDNLAVALEGDLDASLASEARGIIASAATEDHREAVRAFVEKRDPKFSGR